jgi:putative glutamine amidotransferase
MTAAVTAARPFIGICAASEPARWSFWEQDAALVADTYLEKVRHAGGLPLVLVPDDLGPADVEALIDRVDGLLLIGGADVDPEVYGEAASPRTERTVPVRDRFELALVREALNRDVPVLGVCRGLQILNVAAGGTLHQHLTDEGFAEHRRAPGRLDEPTHHEVELDPGTLVASAAGALRQTVNSHHHQGVAVVGDGGRVTARSVPDGVVEAIEWPAQRYAVGVQWHPEAMELSTTIAGFVDAAALHAAGPTAHEPMTGSLT